jgi:hypothetical protein
MLRDKERVERPVETSVPLLVSRGGWLKASAKTQKEEDLEFGLERVKEHLLNAGAGGAKGKLLIEWENVTASAPFTVN